MYQKMGLVVEGGGTKAAYTAGVLKAFLQEKIYIPYTVGISAGCEMLANYVSRQPYRLEVSGVEATSQPTVFGLKAYRKEGSLYGLETTNAFIESKEKLDLEKFWSSSSKMDFGLYNLDTHQVEYFDKSHLDESQTLMIASCALLLLAHPYEFEGQRYMDAGLRDMISIEQSLRQGNDRHIVISTKEIGYVRKPAPKWQLRLAKHVYHDDVIVEDLKNRHLRYKEQWDKVDQLEREGKAMVLRPHKDLGVTRYTTSEKKLRPWFQLGFDETMERMDKIKAFCEVE